MFKWARWVLFCAVAINCTTTSREQSWAPPIIPYLEQLETSSIDKKSLEIHLRNSLAGETDKPKIWWAKYQLAAVIESEKPEESCVIYSNLANDKDFPLNQVSLLKSFSVCDTKAEHLSYTLGLLENKSKDSQWLRRYLALVGIGISKENTIERAKFHFYRSYDQTTQSEKIKSLEKSMSISKKLGETEFEKTEERLERLAPRLSKKKVEKKNLFRLAYDHRKAREFKKALRVYEKIIKSDRRNPDLVYRALSGIQTTYKLLNDRKNEIKTAIRLEANARIWLNSSKRKSKVELANLYHKSALKAARRLWTENEKTEALRLLKRAKKRLKKWRTPEHILWIEARIKEEEGRFKEAYEDSAEALKHVKKGQDIWEKLQWQTAWNARKIKKYTASNGRLEELINATDSLFMESKFRYWLGRNFLDMGDKVRATVEFEHLLSKDALGYYGMLAYRALGRKLPPLNDRHQKRDIASIKHETVDDSILDWLISLNEKELARDYIRSKGFELKEDSRAEALVYYFTQVNEYNRVFAFIAGSSVDFRNGLVLEKPRLLFPRPHYSIVSESAQKYGVRAELIYSIMRQESAFNRFARSHADAFGLMQLLPRVARRSAQKTGVEFGSPEDLYNPQVVIPLGAHHLQELLDKFDDQFILTVASYNASEQAVRGWVKTRFNEDPVEFIEDIPYAETQLYIKLVMRNLVFYQRLLYETPTEFPEWCLSGLQSFKS